MSGLVIGDWSVKDVLAHVAFWEEIAIPDFERAARGHKLGLATFQPQKYTDRWNEISRALRRDFPLAQVLHELHGFREQMTRTPPSPPAGPPPTGLSPRTMIASTQGTFASGVRGKECEPWPATRSWRS